MPAACKAEQYLKHAEECRREAARCSTSAEKKQWLVLREQWLTMAQDIDMRLHKSNAPGTGERIGEA
jgi:hypothetical protein